MKQDEKIDALIWYIRWRKAASHWFNVSPSREEFNFAKLRAEEYDALIRPLIDEHVAEHDNNILYASRWDERLEADD